jgi:uncharacterized membrane protein
VEPARPVPPFTISDTVTYSWNATLRNFGPLMLVSLVVFVGNALAILIGEANGTVGLDLAFNLIAVLVDLLLVLGLIRASLDVVQGRRPSVGEVFRPEGVGPYLVASIFYLVGVYLGLVVLVLPGVVFGVIFQFYGYVVAEHPDVSAMTALRRSAEITKGTRLRLVGLAGVLFLVNVTGALVCVVGLVVTYAITAIAIAYTYRILTDQPVATL